MGAWEVSGLGSECQGGLLLERWECSGAGQRYWLRNIVNAKNGTELCMFRWFILHDVTFTSIWKNYTHTNTHFLQEQPAPWLGAGRVVLTNPGGADQSLAKEGEKHRGVGPTDAVQAPVLRGDPTLAWLLGPQQPRALSA